MDPSSAAAAYIPLDDVDFDQYEQEEIMFGDFDIGEVNTITHLFSSQWCSIPYCPYGDMLQHSICHSSYVS